LLKRIGYKNKLASFVYDRFEHISPYRQSKLADCFMDVAYSNSMGCKLCTECCTYAHKFKNSSKLDLAMCNTYFDVVSDILWHLNISSRKQSKYVARVLVYEMTHTNWERLTRDRAALANTPMMDLIDSFCCDLVYFSDRWSLNRLLRSTYSFGDMLIKNDVNVYDLCYKNRFHKNPHKTR